MTVFSVTRYKYYKHSVSGGQIDVFRHLKMHKLVEKPKRVFLISRHI